MLAENNSQRDYSKSSNPKIVLTNGLSHIYKELVGLNYLVTTDKAISYNSQTTHKPLKTVLSETIRDRCIVVGHMDKIIYNGICKFIL